MKIEALLPKAKTVYTLVGSAVSAIPGMTAFALFPPPLFPDSTIIISGFCAAFFLLVLMHQRYYVPVAGLLLSSFCLLVGYWMLYQLCTVQLPDEVAQVGFGTYEWSLTSEGLKCLHSNYIHHPTNEGLLECAGLLKSYIPRIWTNVSVNIAGVTLIFLLLTASILWTWGWAYLIKQTLLSKLIP